MLRQPVSPVMLELPLSRDLDLDHKLEIRCSSLPSSRGSGNIFFLGYTQSHAGLLPVKSRDHT